MKKDCCKIPKEVTKVSTYTDFVQFGSREWYNGFKIHNPTYSGAWEIYLMEEGDEDLANGHQYRTKEEGSHCISMSTRESQRGHYGNGCRTSQQGWWLG